MTKFHPATVALVGMTAFSTTVLLVAGLGALAQQPAEPKVVEVGYIHYVDVLVDPLTGCHYLRNGALTPRLSKDGKQICTEVK